MAKFNCTFLVEHRLEVEADTADLAEKVLRGGLARTPGVGAVTMVAVIREGEEIAVTDLEAHRKRRRPDPGRPPTGPLGGTPTVREPYSMTQAVAA